ncbi:LytR C-terminal domain-containing protein [Arthrobacter burdickii]|uniref:LytR C-terminal domain-containing protein n=1 Tax=Arthrobacter burdickii TaxID=3035920 RepID=A0ABT8K543_9MICC|nr:LytR C-terminal domain-containing protein [Arthrobacter burdickii]MDN4612142.1 LytR C-terminal domain-containing protein [Arthrobacter burdickii]
MTEHPRDEFDRVPEASVRQGVHRERVIPAGSSGLGLKITVGVLALLIGLGSYFLLPRLGLAGGGGAAASATGQSTASGPASDPSSTANGDASTDATEEPSSDGTASDEDADEDADEVDDSDRAQTVNVLNGTGAPGLASVAAGRLASAGWTSALPGNWAGAPVDASVVFYNGEAQRAGAEAVAEDLGITNLVDSADVSPDISVVLGPEFQ